MMKHILLPILAATWFAGTALAQNTSQISSVQNGQSCLKCNLFQADLAYYDLPDIDLSGSRLRQADLSLSTMNGTNFSKSDMSIANLFGGRFAGADFTHTNLSNANLVGAHFWGANFKGSDLSGANLSGAELDKAHGLTQFQLSLACGDKFTRLRAGYYVNMC